MFPLHFPAEAVVPVAQRSLGVTLALGHFKGEEPGVDRHPRLELRPGFKDCHRQDSGVALPVVTIDGPEACCDVDDAAMICAVLEFSYAGTDTSPKLLAKNGFYTANLGDCAQTIAARGVLERLGLTAADVPGIDRDTLPD